MCSVLVCLVAMLICGDLNTGVSQVDGLAQGGSFTACRSLTPDHGPEISPQECPSPYGFELVDAEGYIPGQPLTIKITGPGPFQGFMMQVRNEKNKPVGRFSKAPLRTKLMICEQPDDTFTHSHPNNKRGTKVIWTPPGDLTGPLTIKYVIL